MRSYLWIFLLATLVAGVISEEGDGSETVPEADAEPADPVPVEEAAPEEGSPTESDPEGEAAPEEGTDVQEESEAAGTATEAPPAVEEAPVEEEAAAGETEAAPEATSEEAAAPTEGADTNEAAVPEGTAAPAPPETEEETQGEVDSTDETAPEATEAPAEKEAEVEAEAGGSATAEETAPDGATEAPVSNEEVEAPVVVEEAKPVEDPVDGFDLSDALGPANEPPADSGKGRARSAGAASGPDGAAEEPKEAGSGKIAGILSAIVVAVVGAASGYFAYQKKKLCFKPQADPESAHKEDPATQAEPQVLSNLLSSS